MLEDLTDSTNEQAWREFDGRFRPILVAFARRLGLADADAADIAQETLARVVKSYREGHYDRSRGRMHSWIVGIAQNCIYDHRKTSLARREQRGVSAIVEVPDRDHLADLWDQQCEQEILQQALEALKEETRTDARTLRAFELFALRHQPPEEVARDLGLATNDVYLAKHRCLKRLRAIVAELNVAYEVNGAGEGEAA
jgi:RNA polymerase sigma-70 factor (ECF subfamily)